MERYVIIDVETTGVSFTKGDRIIQLAFVIVENQQVVERFSSYINPERTIPNFIQSLTNIDDLLVTDAPLFNEIAPKLLEALNGAFFVAHNVEFDLNFINEELKNAGYEAFRGPILDTVELSRIAFPTADGFKLSQLSEDFLVDHNQPHRADSDAEATSQLFIQIMKKLSSLPYETLLQIDRLKNGLKSDVNSLLHEWMLMNSTANEQGYDYFRGLVLRKVNQDTIEEDITEFQDFRDYFQSCLSNDAWCQERMAGYERRNGQLEMMSFIYDAMKTRQMGMIEAGTGTGKSLGYLIPAVFLAIETKKPVVISTHTVQLQEQLLKKELEKVKAFLPFKMNTALLKGRSHYLCLKKFEQLLQEDPVETYDRTVSKAQILVWLTETETGDVEELSLASQSNRFWHEICSDSFSCITPKCPWFSRCFYQRAKNYAKKAHIIITNHSLVLSDIKADHQLIPSYDRIILDEAHHFEDTATDQFGLQLDYLSLTHLINELGQVDGTGLLMSVAKQGSGELEIVKHAISADEAGKILKQEWNELFLLLHQHVLGNKGKSNERGRASVKIDINDGSWATIEEAVHRCEKFFKEWEDSLIQLSDALETVKDDKTNVGIMEGLRSFINRASKVHNSFYLLFMKQDSSMIYWLESETKGPKQAVYIHGRPINVSERLADDFFNKKESVVLTSATLTVNNKFNYIIQRLGLDDFSVITKVVPSPFQWDKQVRLMVPSDMPLIQESGESAYIEAVVMQIYRISQVSKGKMLVLFTSYDMLKKSYYYLKDMLSDEYTLIAQGVQSGSRTKLTKNFQQFEQAILLGTSSFWEGVDIPGRDLSVIIIVRLPFSPPNDPVFEAKSAQLKEEGKNPFMKLALPQAILRFKQGFGRLIRRTSDRGVVVVLDRRLVATKYGKSFINSLPSIPVLDKSMDDLETDILDWL